MHVNATTHPLLAETALRRLSAKCDVVDAPFEPLPQARFDAAHEAFERSSSQQSEILKFLRRFGIPAFGSKKPARVLSVGPGNGMLDLKFIESMVADGVAADYVGVDPSRVAGERFAESFRAIESNGVSLKLHACGVEDFDDGDFDLIHAVHSLYYLPNPSEMLDRLISRLTPEGRLVVFHAPRGALNKLAKCFWRGDAGGSVWFSDRLESWLTEAELPFEKLRLDARLDVTKALDLNDPAGRLILDFIFHTASDRLDAAILRSALDYLRTISEPEGDRWLAPHPVDAFVISPA